MALKDAVWVKYQLKDKRMEGYWFICGSKSKWFLPSCGLVKTEELVILLELTFCNSGYGNENGESMNIVQEVVAVAGRGVGNLLVKLHKFS